MSYDTEISARQIRLVSVNERGNRRADMTIHEFGEKNKDILVMFHPLGVWWDVFEYVIPELSKHFHLIIPAIPGHDPDVPLRDFSSVEEISEEIGVWLRSRGYGHVNCLYGCSMGGALVMRMLADHIITADNAVIDAGITPYRLPKPVTYLIGIKDFLMTMSGKYMSVKALSGVFDPEKYSDTDGMYHGALLVLFEIIRKKSAFYKKHKKDKWFMAASWFVTMHLVLVGFFIFSGKCTSGITYLLRTMSIM